MAEEQKNAESYNPLNHSIVQAMNGTWEDFAAPDYVDALLSELLSEIRRVHWNLYAHEWGPTWHSDSVEDPEIDGIVFTRYYDGCACEDEPEHAPECRHSRPNFAFDGVAFRWYKRPGRGMSTNKNLTPEEWVNWFNKCLAHIQSQDFDPMCGDAERDKRERRRADFDSRHSLPQRRMSDDIYRDSFKRIKTAIVDASYSGPESDLRKGLEAAKQLLAAVEAALENQTSSFLSAMIKSMRPTKTKSAPKM